MYMFLSLFMTNANASKNKNKILLHQLLIVLVYKFNEKLLIQA